MITIRKSKQNSFHKQANDIELNDKFIKIKKK